MCSFIKLFIFAIILSVINCESKHNEDSLLDFNKYYKKLSKHAKIGIKTYLEIPDPDVLINQDSSRKYPCKLLNQSEQVVQMFNRWDEKHLANELMSSFLFADMSEVINDEPIQTRTNLRRFLGQLEQYTYETNVFFKINSFLK